MKRQVKTGIFVLLLSLMCAHSVFAIAGIGFHYGLDYSLKLDDSPYQQLETRYLTASSVVNSIPNINSLLPSGWTIDTISKLITDNGGLANSYAPFSLKRSGWQRTWMNFGGKIYIDIIPFIDAIELSGNFGAWEYLAQVKYPSGKLKTPNPDAAAYRKFAQTGDYENIFEMNVYDLTLENTGIKRLKAFGISKTPFVKLHFDLTARKTLIGLPPLVNILKIYAGAGPSLHFTSPVMSNRFIQDFIAENLKEAGNNITKIGNLIPTNVGPALVNQIVKESYTPTWGINLEAGTMVKFPVVPIGIYIDGKYMIPFADMDKDVKELKGFGFLINAGISFGL